MASRQRRDIGAEIRQLRRAKGWTQAELGARVDLPSPLNAGTISRIERGVTVATPSTFAAVAAALARPPQPPCAGRAGRRPLPVVPRTPRRDHAFMTLCLTPPDWEIVRVTYAPGQDPVAPPS